MYLDFDFVINLIALHNILCLDLYQESDKCPSKTLYQVCRCGACQLCEYLCARGHNHRRRHFKSRRQHHQTVAKIRVEKQIRRGIYAQSQGGCGNPQKRRRHHRRRRSMHKPLLRPLLKRRCGKGNRPHSHLERKRGNPLNRNENLLGDCYSRICSRNH